MDKGIAKNTAAVQNYLDRCAIVTTYREHPETPEYLEFEYDGIEGVEIAGFPGVWFDEDAMSTDATDAFTKSKRRHAASEDVIDAIKQSIRHDEVAEIDNDPGVQDALMVECDDHEGAEYWGTLDGDQWRVRVVSVVA